MCASSELLCSRSGLFRVYKRFFSYFGRLPGTCKGRRLPISVNSSGFQSRTISHGGSSDRPHVSPIVRAPRAALEKLLSLGPQKKQNVLVRSVHAVTGGIGGAIRWLIKEKNRLGWKM